MTPSFFRPSILILSLLLGFLPPAPPCRGAEKLLILGDSLSKEYEIEWLGIGGDPLAAPVENWCEILDNRRGAWFEYGGSGAYSDWRIAGHAYNWSAPGSETLDWRGMLETPPADLKNQIRSEVDRAVIFLGGNNAREKYPDLYNGKAAAAWIESTLADIAFVLDFVKSENPALPLVLVNVPHVGCTPSINDDFPWDPVKTDRVNTAMDQLNAGISALAQSRGVGLADVYSMTRELVTAERWVLSGYKVEKTSSGSGAPNALFLGDGFHPGMAAQGIFAQRILDAFNTRYQSNIPRLASREILVDVLGVNADLTMAKWTQNFGIISGDRGFADDPDKDRMKNIVEYTLDMDPTRPDNQLMPRPRLEGGNLTMTWQPRDPAGSRSSLFLQESSDLASWTNVSSADISNLEFNTLRFSRPMPANGRLFLRFRATEIK